MGLARWASIDRSSDDHCCCYTCSFQLIDPTAAALLQSVPIGPAEPYGSQERVLVVSKDVLSHRVTNFEYDNGTADIADNHYYLYKQDLARLAALGVKAYSFSISWSRIMPFGRGPVNQLAIDHYNDLINTCLEYNIIPLATLYHWDTPLALQDTYGGWLSENIVNDFVEYARVAYAAFGDRVDNWFTVNERTLTLSFMVRSG